MKITWPDMNGLTAAATLAYLGFSTALITWLWTWHPAAALAAGIILAAIAFHAAESHAATQKLIRPLPHHKHPTQNPTQTDPEDTWNS